MSDEGLEGMSESARSLLRQARGPRPRTADERARTTRSVARIATAPVVAGGAWLSWKGAVLAAALVAGGMGTAAFVRRQPGAVPATRLTAPSAPRPAAPATVPTATVAPRAERPVTPPTVPARAVVVRVDARAPTGGPRRSVLAPVDGRPVAPTVTPVEPPRTLPSGGSNGPVAAAAEDELGTLERARTLLRHDPAEALRIVDGIGAMPGSPLAEERALIAVEALQRLGRADAMRARAEDFLRRWPRSLYAERVRRWLGS